MTVHNAINKFSFFNIQRKKGHFLQYQFFSFLLKFFIIKFDWTLACQKANFQCYFSVKNLEIIIKHIELHILLLTFNAISASDNVERQMKSRTPSFNFGSKVQGMWMGRQLISSKWIVKKKEVVLNANFSKF